MLEGYITPLLTSYLDRYVRNIKPSDLQLSFWGGDAVLRNLELRVDVLEKELLVPLEFMSGRIRELTLHIPWNAIVSSPVQVTIKDLELVVRLKNVRASSTVQPSKSTDSSEVDPPTTVVPITSSNNNKEKGTEQAPGYLQSYLNRISNNIQVHVQNLVVKVMEEECDLMLTLNIGEVVYFTADENWDKTFVYTDYLQGNYAIHKVCKVSDMTVNLHAIEVGGQEATPREPFLQRCSFAFRMRSEFRGNIFVKKSNNILFDSLTFSVDEKQFCLFIHLMEWFLAVYYSRKKLKGRDDVDVLATSETPKPSKAIPTSSPTTPESAVGDSRVISPVKIGEMNSASNQSWGSWMWSFVTDVEETDDSSSHSHQGNSGPPSPDSKQAAIEPSSTFSIFAKSVHVTLKVTHQVQVPLFYSFRHFTTPVVCISLTGCLAQVDKVSLTKLFLFSMGIASVRASVTGLCPCVKRFPSSWRRTSVVAASPTADPNEEIVVFSMGVVDKEEGCHDDSKVIEIMLKRSLFAPPIATPTTPDSATIELPPLSKPDLAHLGKHYRAIWFTYQYFDISSARSVEECTETLRVGHVTTSFSPDVLHRLQHFILALKKSLAANPRFSEGMVVLGDPEAETKFNIEVVGLQALFTSNSHYLSTASSSSPHTMPKSKKTPKKAKKPKSTALPTLCVVSSGLTANLTLPMYSGNATPDTPQRTQIKAKASGLHCSALSLQKLEDAEKHIIDPRGEAGTNGSNFKQFLHVPSVEFNYHTKSHGEELAGEKEKAYMQLDTEKITASLSHTHLSKLLFLTGTWAAAESHTSSSEVECPAHPGSKLGHVHVSMLKTTLSCSASSCYSLTSAVISEVSVAMVKDAGSKKLGCLLPILYGPIRSQDWNKAEYYMCKKSPSVPLTTPTERLVEFFIARPYQNVKDSMFPTFQLNVNGFAASLEPSLLQFVNQLPYDAYNAGADINHTTEGTQLPLDRMSMQAPPTIATPSVMADEEQVTTRPNHLSEMKGFATKVKIKPVILVFPEQDYVSFLTDSCSVNSFQEFPILSLLSSPSFSPSPSAVVVALPDILLESARSHVLDEPVSRESQLDTLPWDCSLADLSIFTIVKQKARYLLEPLVVKATLAPQQEGSGITVHLDTLTLSVSNKQVKLVNCVSHKLIAMATRSPSTSASSQPTSIETDDSGIIVSSRQEPSAPSIISSPAPSTVTPPTLPAGSEVSTVSSSLVFQGFSTLWIQLLVSKLILNVYSRQKASKMRQEGPIKYSSPFTSPAAASEKAEMGVLTSKPSSDTVRVSLEADGVSLQVDMQERCTDVIFKMASMECSYCRRHPAAVVWQPYLSRSNGKLFSTTTSSLPEELSQITDPLSQPLNPYEHIQAPSSSSSIGYLLSPQHQLSPKLQPNFVQMKLKIPQSPPLKAIKMSVSVKPFEVVAWLPVFDTILAMFSVDTVDTQDSNTKPPQSVDGGRGGVASWPSLEVNIEPFRVVLPNSDHTHFLLLSVGGVTITSSLDYAGPDVRYITDSSAFRRLSLLSSERKQPALPAYQLEALSLSMWGVRNSTTSVSAALFGSCSNLRVVYTPPLYWTPLHPVPALLLTPPTVPGRSRCKLSVLATGHCAEVNLTSDVVVFFGSHQVDSLAQVMSKNFLPRHDNTSAHIHSADGAQTNEKVGIPLKFLLSGHSLSLILTSEVDAETPPVSCQLVTPLMLATVYNPVCMVGLSGSDAKMEVSCFNMAVSYSLEQTSLSYIELAAEPLSLAGLMKHQLLETKKGLSQDKSGLPPSLLSVSWSRKSEDLESGSKGGVASLEVGRPLKLSFSLTFLHEALRTLIDLKKVAQALSTQQHNGDSMDGDLSGQKAPSQFATPNRSELTTPLTNKELCFNHQDSETYTKLTELIVTTDQVLVELILTDSEGGLSLSPGVAAQETDVPLQGETVSPVLKSFIEEGLVLAWQSFSLTILPADKLIQTSELAVDNLQLLAVTEGLPLDVVPPIHLNCLATHHKPCSVNDIPHTGLKFSLGLLQVNVSRSSVELARRAVDDVVELLHSLSSKLEQTESHDSQPVVARGDSCEVKKVYFTDDLRTEDFTYNLNESTAAPPIPQPGNIVFHHGNGASPPSMTWQYGEPRAITRLYILPVPFTITTEEDAPVDIKLSCSLEYWNEASSCYQVLMNFYVSESAHAEWDLSESISLASIASRRWRICVNHIEWVDEDMEEILMESVTSVSGTTVPLSSVLSPVSLAASTKIDSVFSPYFIPLISMAVHCEQLQLTLLHWAGNLSDGVAIFEGYKVVPSHRGQEGHELLRLSVNNGRLFLSQMRNGSTRMKVEAILKGDYVDEGLLVWRTALYPTKVDLMLENEVEVKGTNLSDPVGSGLFASLKCGPAAFRVCQGLVHTTSMAAHLWREREDDRIVPAAILLHAHYILCNDTLDDIHFGQVATGEDILLPSNCCTGYSWRNHKAEQLLHVCLVADGSWRWTTPFTISEGGVQAIEIPVGRHLATLIISMTHIGGLQKKVTFLGSWKFFSFLHYPLELQFTLASNSPSNPHSKPHGTKRHSSFAAAPQLRMLTLQPGESLPSVVAAESLLEGVRFRIAGGNGGWSTVYPLGNSVHQWTKPHLLAELSRDGDVPLHFWYNTAPLETSGKKAWGNKIRFSPLFAITNHMPYELVVTVADPHTLPSLPTLPSTPSPPNSPTLLGKEWLLPVGGATKPFYSLSADSWYHLHFQISGSAGRSEPSLALSTLLLHHLPISKEEGGQDLEQPADNKAKPAIAYLSLPVDKSSSCTTHAYLVRNSLNTITAVLFPEMMLVNECPWEVELTELVSGDNEKEETLLDGKTLAGDRRDKKTVLGPSSKAVCVWKQFNLSVRWEDIPLKSKSLSFPALPLGHRKSKSEDSKKSIATIQLVPSSREETQQVVAEVTLTFVKCDTTITATIRPSYVIHNNTGTTIHAWPCVLSKHDPPPKEIGPNVKVTMEIPSGTAQPVLFWQKLTDKSRLDSAFRLTAASTISSPSSWSIFLSPHFVRHSLSLPTDDHARSNMPALLTMHETENTVFLVVAQDPSPRLVIQNLCPVAVEVIEAGSRGVHSSPQLVFPGHEVIYDPPSLAKLYPLICDSDIASEEEKRLYSNAQKLSLCFRISAIPAQDPGSGWSKAYPLANEQDVVLGVPELGDVLISTDHYGHSQFISVLPTGQTQAVQAAGSLIASLVKPPRNELRLSCSLTKLVLCVDDETESQQTVSQILRVVADEADMLYWRSNSIGTKLELTIHSLQVDNMMVQSCAEFSVLVLPRSEHAARPQLIRYELPPLFKALVQFSPCIDGVVDLVHVMVQPLTVQLEDSLLHKLRAILPSYTQPGTIRVTSTQTNTTSTSVSSGVCVVPGAILREAEIDATPLIISRLVIGPSAVYLTASVTLKAFLSCRDSPFRFAEYELTNISSNLSEVSQVVAARYVSTVFMHLGWLLGSLELIGSPGTFIQSIGSGLRDLVSLPYEGLTRSPGLFIIGIGHGALSFVRNFSTGALASITNFASSIARNMERLSMDSEHSSYKEHRRKEQPTTHFTSGVSTGVSSFGLSLISAVAGIVDQPMQSFQRLDESSSTLSATRSVLAGVGKGLIGVVTKPVGGAMELVSHTGQGIMHGTGLMPKLRHASVGDELETFVKLLDKSEFDVTVTSCQRKLEDGPCLALVPAIRTTSNTSEQIVFLLLTPDKLYLLDCESNTLQQNFSIAESKLEKKDTSLKGLVEVHLTPHVTSPDKDVLSPSNFQTVEYYLKLSQMEAQDLPHPITVASDNNSSAAAVSGDEKCTASSSSAIVLHINEKDTTRLLSTFHSIRSHILEPELSFCVYSFHAAQTKDDSFFSVTSQPTA